MALELPSLGALEIKSCSDFVTIFVTRHTGILTAMTRISRNLLEGKGMDWWAIQDLNL
jgi:hypothetical protein